MVQIYSYGLVCPPVRLEGVFIWGKGIGCPQFQCFPHLYHRGDIKVSAPLFPVGVVTIMYGVFTACRGIAIIALILRSTVPIV